MVTEKKPNKTKLNLYIRQLLQDAFIKYCEEKDMPRSTVVNNLLMEMLHKEGYI